MIDKEVAELRRRLKADRSAITKIYGCYVNPFGEILASFEQSMALLPQAEQEKYFELLKKAVSGSMGRTLSDLSFATSQVVSGAEHALLMKLRDSRLEDAEARQALFDKIAASLRLGENSYLIVLAHDVYDVPFRGKDGLGGESETQFSYLLCAIAPVKETKPVLRYEPEERAFRSHGVDYVAGNPELGFLFPAFDERSTNLYGALLYNRSRAESHEAFIDAVLHVAPPMAVDVQKDSFRDVLTDALEDECSHEVVQAVRTQLRELEQTHEEAHVPEPCTVSAREVGDILEDQGVSEPKRAAFRVKFEEAFGADSALPPRNLLSSGQLEYKTPDVLVKVNPDRPDLVELRELGGVKYLLIKADEGVALNGVPLQD